MTTTFIFTSPSPKIHTAHHFIIFPHFAPRLMVHSFFRERGNWAWKKVCCFTKKNESKAGNMSVIMDIKYCNADPLSMNYIREGGMHKGDVQTTEEIGVEEKFLCSLSLSVNHNLARDGYIESTCCCVKARVLGMAKNTLSFVMVWYSALFNNVFKALNFLK
jgi:hypothetical protein